MQTTPQIYKIYTQKCTNNNIIFLSYALFLNKIKDQNIAKLKNGFVFRSDFDAFNYLFDNNLHFRQKANNAKPQKRITKSSIAKILSISRSALNEKLLLAPKYPHIKRLKFLIEKSVEQKEITQNDKLEIQKLAKIPVTLVKKLAKKQLKNVNDQKIYEISSNFVSN